MKNAITGKEENFISHSTHRGISVDSTRANPVNPPMTSNLISQTVRGYEGNTLASSLVHSLSPPKRWASVDNFLIPPQSGPNLGKKMLILDLDETLIHSSFQPFPSGADILLQIEIENVLTDIHVLKRRGLDEFLSRMGKLYEIAIFTASLSKYADPLIDIIDKEKVCSFRLFREHCTLVNGCYVKELRRMNRSMKSIMLLDNNPASYYLDVENGIPIKSFYEDRSDIELYHYADLFEKMANVSDVRAIIKEIVVMNQVSFHRAHLIFNQGKISSPPQEEEVDQHYFQHYVKHMDSIVPINTYEVQAVIKQTPLQTEKNKLKILSVQLIKNTKGINDKSNPAKNKTNQKVLTSSSLKSVSNGNTLERKKTFRNGSSSKANEVREGMNHPIPDRTLRNTSTTWKSTKIILPKPHNSTSKLILNKPNVALTSSNSNKIISKDKLNNKIRLEEDSDISTRPATTGVLVKNIKISLNSQLTGTRSCSSLHVSTPQTSKSKSIKGHPSDSYLRKFEPSTTRSMSKEYQTMHLHHKTPSLPSSKQSSDINLNKLVNPIPSSTRSNLSGINFFSNKGLSTRTYSSLKLHKPSSSSSTSKVNMKEGIRSDLKIVRVVTNKSLNSKRKII